MLGLPTILLALDLSVLYLALPRLSADLGATNTEQLWITDIYGFVTAGFLVTMGTLGDRVGRRKLLLIGAASFGAASIVAASSTTVGMLVGARALMGLAGATLMPSTLALITNMFPRPSERATAIAAWTSCFMVGAAVGPVVGGVLLEHFGWGSLFLLGVPVMVLLLISAPFVLPEYKDRTAGSLDLASVALSLAAILPFIYGVKTLAKDGLTATAIAAAAIGGVAGAAFVSRQRTLASPLLDTRLFHNRRFTAALLILMFGLAAQGGIMLLVSEHLQMVEGFTPLRAGLSLMPASVAMIAACIAAPIAARRFSIGWIIGTGLIVSAAGYVVLAQVSGNDDGMRVIVAMILVFAGVGPMAVFSQDLIVGSVPPEKAGSAAALSETSGDLGIAFGVAIFGSLGAATYARRMSGIEAILPPGVTRLAWESVAQAVAVAARLPAPLGDILVRRAQDAFTDGLHAAAIVSAAVSLVLAVVAVRELPSGVTRIISSSDDT